MIFLFLTTNPPSEASCRREASFLRRQESASPTPIGTLPWEYPPAEGLSFRSGDACPHFREDDGRHDWSPVKGHPDAEKSCHRVAPATDRREAAAVALRYQSACPSTLLRDPADGEFQQKKISINCTNKIETVILQRKFLYIYTKISPYDYQSQPILTTAYRQKVER